ncbi:MAG: VCBS repeat-containing protein, partial [Candidatus Marinimicrobia bacterium]|nr:VCBS repeat-containing protein [Candidatus Neomarinimicrobiota bacterium]
MNVKRPFHFVSAGIIFLMLSVPSWSQIREPDIYPFAQTNTILLKTAGAFNFDNDDFFDIIGVASQIDAKGNHVPRSTYLVHLESTASGELNILWKFAIPENLNGDFTDVTVSDLDGDGSPEIAAVISISEIVSGVNPGSLYIFKYTDGFSKEPTAIINIAEKQSVRPRPLFIDAGDMNGDRKNDLVISSIGPGRGISIICFNGQISENNTQILFQSSNLKVLLGFLQFRAVSADLDTFPGEDLLIFGGKKDLEIEVYRSDFNSTPVYFSSLKNINRSEIDLAKIVWGDLDGDGFDEILIPLKNG